MNDPKTFTMILPDDWHDHLRDNEDMEAVLPFVVPQVKRAIIMPNLHNNLITTWEKAKAYEERIRKAAEKLPYGKRFVPLMVLYINEETTVKDIIDARKYGNVIAGKVYPMNGTTNSYEGVQNYRKLKPVLQAMAGEGMLRLFHGESPFSNMFGDKTRKDRNGNFRVAYLRREAVFLKEQLSWIIDECDDGNTPGKTVLEHITTAEAVNFIINAPAHVGATVTAHHPLITNDDVVESHHNKCMPIAKEEEHRQVILHAITSGNPKFFAGSDSAPHSKASKETHCGCAGCFTSLHMVELYATAFEERNALDRLEAFMSIHGAEFYGLPVNTDTITVERKTWTIPEEVSYGYGEKLVPFWAGKELHWKMRN